MSISWGCIQPLTGGFYLGAEQAFDSNANFIISFPGFSDANEKWLLEYNQKRKIQIPYFLFNQHHFDYIPDGMDPTFKTTEWYKPGISDEEIKKELANLQKVDVVIALPFCSALSLASGCFDEHNSGSTGTQNNNMKFISQYVLGTIKPKAYIFENAPALYTARGEGVRLVLNELASKFGYSITYVKTNSNLHENVQYRERTFAIFWKNEFVNSPPKLNFINNQKSSVVEFLSHIPSWSKHNDPVLDDCGKDMILQSPLYRFMYDKYGKDYRIKINSDAGRLSIGLVIMKLGLYAEAREYVKNSKTKCPPSVETFDRWYEKFTNNQGWWDYSPCLYPENKTPTVYFKSVGRIIHPTEERGFTKREFLTLMKFPYDFDIPESETDFPHRIGQNVPVTTGKDWCIEIKNILENWDNKRKIIPNGDKNNIYFHNNCKPEQSHYQNLIVKNRGFSF